LWEHLVLNEMNAKTNPTQIKYWRDKSGHEIDFILTRRGKPPIAIECKWSEKNFDPKSLIIFKKKYPQGENWFVAHDVQKNRLSSVQNHKIECFNLAEFSRRLDTLL
jgi:hypothetical protein